MVTATDGELSGGGALDTFRIKIWMENEVTGEEIIIYDNGLEGTEIGGGSIKIHIMVLLDSPLLVHSHDCGIAPVVQCICRLMFKRLL